MIDANGLALTARLGDQVFGVFDGFRAPDFGGTRGPAAPTGGVHEGPRPGQLNRDGAPRTPCGSGQ